MRRTVLWFVPAVFFVVNTASAADTHPFEGQTGIITVQLAGFENDRGDAKLCLCRSESEHRGTTVEFHRAITEINNGKATWVFKNVPYGSYSIKAFHDENGNNQLDKNILGRPTERYGFSNNADGRVGLPPFSKAAFTINSPATVIEIYVQ